jgi:Bacterial archaeo-eukaryotic release factor family 3
MSNGRTMQLSIHYYVLSLTKRRSRLYEGFRDTLIDIQNTGFPFEAPSRPSEHYKLLSKLERLGEFLSETDQHFERYFAQDPLWMVLVGERKMLSIFKSTMSHGHALMGELEVDYSAVSTSDLGKIVWSVVKKALAGSNDRALDELQAAAETKTIVIGFDAVGRAVQSGIVSSSLFVEEDYHLRGSIREADGALVLSPHVDVSDVIDDAVDLIVEKVLSQGGNVVFLESNTMTKFQKIALIVRGAASSVRIN